MKKILMASVFGFTTAAVVMWLSPYTILNWQWWVATLAILAVGAVYAHTDE